MRHQEWHERYVSMLAAHVQRPSEDLSRRTAELGDALVRARVSPRDFVAAHMACVEQLCTSRAGGDGTASRRATSLLLEVMKAYGRCLQEPRGTPRRLVEQTDQSDQTAAHGKRLEELVQGTDRQVATRAESRAADLAATNEQLQQEIGERKRAEERLRESEQRYRALFEQAADAILLVDGDTGGLVEFNDRAHERLGYTREEFRKLKIADIEVTESPEEIARHIAAIYKSGAETFETKHRTKTGEIRDILVNCKVIPVGQKLLFQAIWSDITERRRAEQEARQRQAELAHVSRLTLMGEMASSLSHDISQPLSTILFYARGCVRRIRSGTADPAALLDVMEKVALQAEAAGRIVRRLREFVSKRAPHLSTVDVNDVVRQSLSLVQSEISEAGITLRFQAAESLPPVRADRIQIEQVILNLVRNGIEALQAVEAGRRELTIATSSSAGDTITVAVHDTGPGLSAEVAERVFDSFFTTKPNGMGMGLSISRSIIEVHGGRLWVVPNAERGATFQFSLPVMRGAADEEA